LTDPKDSTSDSNRTTEERSWIATIKNLSVARWGVVVAVLALIATLVFGLATACGAENPSPVPPSVNQGTGNNNCSAGAVCNVQISQLLQEAVAKSGGDDSELKKQLRAAPGATQPPNGPAPYPFVAVDTAELGLFARTTNVVKASRVGNTGNRSVVWAICMAVTDFTPPDVTGDNNMGPKWMQVHWKHLEGGINRGLSEPNEPQTAWMYRGALEPVGHNGDIPAC
jgi:hypothetical protein